MPKRKKQEPPRQRKGVAEGWATLFIDLLGWSNQVRAFDEIRNFPHDKPRVTAVIKTACDKLDLARMTILRMVEPREQPDPKTHAKRLEHLGRLGAEQRELFVRLTNPKFVLQQFGDSYIVNIRCSADRRLGFALPLGQLQTLFSQAGFVLLLSLAVGVPLRAAIEVGYGTEYAPRGTRKKELISASIVKAYDLERLKAIYPRIIVGAHIIGFIKEFVDARGSPMDNMTGLCARNVLNMCQQEPDGTVSIDYLGPHFVGPAGITDLDTAHRAYRFIRDSFFEAQRKHKPELVGKYGQVMAYFLRKLGPPPPEPIEEVTPSGSPPPRRRGSPNPKRGPVERGPARV